MAWRFSETGTVWRLLTSRYLGMLRLPFSLRRSIPEPIVRNGVLYGVTSDEIGVLYVVRARIVRD